MSVRGPSALAHVRRNAVFRCKSFALLALMLVWPHSRRAVCVAAVADDDDDSMRTRNHTVAHADVPPRLPAELWGMVGLEFVLPLCTVDVSVLKLC